MDGWICQWVNGWLDVWMIRGGAASDFNANSGKL